MPDDTPIFDSLSVKHTVNASQGSFVSVNTVTQRFTPSTQPAEILKGQLYFDFATSKLKASEDGVSFVDVIGGGGGSPGGADKDIQFNNSGSFGGSSKLQWDDSAGVCTVSSSATFSPSVFNLVSSGAGGSVLFSGYNSDPNGFSEFDIFNDLNNPPAAALTLGMWGSTTAGVNGEGPSAYVISNGSYPLNIGSNGSTSVFCDPNGNVGIGNFSTLDFASGVGVLAIAECTTPPGTPSKGYILYVQGGALMGIGTSGTVTPIGPA